MGGLIEDYMFEVLDRKKVTTSELVRKLSENGHERKYGTISRHLRKMVAVKQLVREKRSDGQYVYWNPRTIDEHSNV